MVQLLPTFLLFFAILGDSPLAVTHIYSLAKYARDRGSVDKPSNEPVLGDNEIPQPNYRDDIPADLSWPGYEDRTKSKGDSIGQGANSFQADQTFYHSIMSSFANINNLVHKAFGSEISHLEEALTTRPNHEARTRSESDNGGNNINYLISGYDDDGDDDDGDQAEEQIGNSVTEIDTASDSPTVSRSNGQGRKHKKKPGLKKTEMTTGHIEAKMTTGHKEAKMAKEMVQNLSQSDTNSSMDENSDVGGDERKQSDQLTTEHGEVIGETASLVTEKDSEPAAATTPFTTATAAAHSQSTQSAAARDQEVDILSDRPYTDQGTDVNHITRLVLYYGGCDTCMYNHPGLGQECPGFQQPTQQMEAWARDFSRLLRYGCSSTGVSAPQRCCHKSDNIVLDLLTQINTLMNRAYQAILQQCSKCPVDCQWQEWQAWSDCNFRCDASPIRERIRKRSESKVRYGGRPCHGIDTERDLCPIYPSVAGQWSVWSPWTTCPPVTGNFIYNRSRHRACQLPSDLTGQPVCPSLCSGQAVEVYPCCTHSSWGAWSSWGQCKPSVRYDHLQTSTSSPCGRGCRRRSRTCIPGTCENSTCAGDRIERISCNLGKCCKPPAWSDWGEWGACSASVGQGQRVRWRVCQPDRAHWDSPTCSTGGCQDQMDNKETEPCEGQCPNCIPPRWSEWGSWEECDFSVSPARRIRRRHCQRSTPWSSACAHLDCDGTGQLSETCLCDPSSWSSWGPWSGCDFSRYPPSRQRQRSCIEPPNPDYCPRQPCLGESVDYNVKGCCGPSYWSEWSGWSSCGADRWSRRSRVCVRPNVSGPDCPPDCYGLPDEETPCDPPAPCDPGQWLTWSSWSECANCHTGVGTESRIRQRISSTSQPSRLSLCLPTKQLHSRGCSNCPPPSDQCVESCQGRADGKYPSTCKEGCTHYVECCEGEPLLTSCHGQSYDSECRTCSLHSQTCPNLRYDKHKGETAIPERKDCPMVKK